MKLKTIVRRIALILALPAFLLMCLLTIQVPLALNPGVRQGWDILEKSPKVGEVFGAPIHAGLVCMGGTKGYLDGTGQGSMTSFFFGSKGMALVEFYVSKDPGTDWNLDSIRILRDGRVALFWIASQSGKGFQNYP